MYADDFPKGQRLAILSEQQGHRCCYCGIRFSDELPADLRLLRDPRPSIEHVRRLCDGGERVWSNEVAACRGCNSIRGEIGPIEFYELIRETPIEALRQAIRAARGLPRGASTSVPGVAYRRINKRLSAGFPPKLGEIPMTPARQAYFDMVYGWRAKEADQTPPMLIPFSKKAKKPTEQHQAFVEIDGIKALRWNIRSI